MKFRERRLHWMGFSTTKRKPLMGHKTRIKIVKWRLRSHSFVILQQRTMKYKTIPTAWSEKMGKTDKRSPRKLDHFKMPRHLTERIYSIFKTSHRTTLTPVQLAWTSHQRLERLPWEHKKRSNLIVGPMGRQNLLLIRWIRLQIQLYNPPSKRKHKITRQITRTKCASLKPSSPKLFV